MNVLVNKWLLILLELLISISVSVSVCGRVCIEINIVFVSQTIITQKFICMNV